MGYFFHFSSLYPAPYIELYVCYPIQISYLNFKAVLVLPKTAGSAQTHKSISFIWIVWCTLWQRYGLRTPDEAFFHWYPKLLGLGRQIGLKNFGAVFKVSYILCYNWTNQSTQAYRWFRDDYITEDNFYTSRNLLIIKWGSKVDFV